MILTVSAEGLLLPAVVDCLRLVRDDRACENRPTRGLVVELSEDGVDQSRHIREQAPVVAEERPECLRHREDSPGDAAA